MYSSISENKRNTIVIFSLFIAVISGIGLYFSYLCDDYSIFSISLFGSLIYAFFEYLFSTHITLAMTGANPIERSESPEFYAAVESVSITAGIPMPKLYVIYDKAPNAFASGTKPENSIVCVTTGLLEIMDKPELEAVVAHEISHIKNYDIRVSAAAVALTASIGFISDIAIRIFINSKSNSRENKSPILIIIGMIFVFISPILAAMIRLAISREREYLADATAVMLTRYPQGMINALSKLRDFSMPMEKQSSTTASLFITNPLKNNLFGRIFSTHPPLEDRIKRLEENSWRF